MCDGWLAYATYSLRANRRPFSRAPCVPRDTLATHSSHFPPSGRRPPPPPVNHNAWSVIVLKKGEINNWEIDTYFWSTLQKTGKMLSSKRGYADLEILSENKRICSGGEEETYWTSCSTLWRLKPDNWSNMCKSVVSITLSDGDRLFASSGIAIECQSNFTKFLTSASLVRVLDGVTNGRDEVKIAVRYGGNVARGFLEEYDLDHEMAIIKVSSILDVHCLRFEHEVLPYSQNVVALGCEINGELMYASGRLSEFPMISTCRLSEVLLGGALFDVNGFFLGMNLFLHDDDMGTIFLPRNVILDRLKDLQPSTERRIFFAMVKPIWDKEKLTGVELSSRPECSMKVKTFGDEYPSGVWGEFRDEVSSNIRHNVVALASFNGETKFFACTGFFIKYDDKCLAILTSASLVRDPDGGNNIVEGLRIDVLLPDKKLCKGKLEHYSLHYNVALVTVENDNVGYPVNLELNFINFAIEVVAVGCCFESGVLIAARGTHADWSGDLDCKNLSYSTCKTTKVGIGGPLVDVNGKFLGMNFYDTKMGTPFLYCDDLCGILNYFRTKETKYWKFTGEESHIVRDDEGPPNIWILPDSSDTDEDELEDYAQP